MNFPTASRPLSRSSTAIPPRFPLPTRQPPKSPASLRPASKTQPSALKLPASFSPSAPLTRPPTPRSGPSPPTKPPLQHGLRRRPLSRRSCRAGSVSAALPAHHSRSARPEDAPFETGALLVTAIHQATPDQLTAFWPTLSPTPGCNHSPPPGSPRALLTSSERFGLKNSRPPTRPLKARVQPHGSGARRAVQPRRKSRPAARPGYLARLLPHQGDLRFLDAPRSRRRRCALRRSPRLLPAADTAPVSARIRAPDTSKANGARRCKGARLFVAWVEFRPPSDLSWFFSDWVEGVPDT